MTYLDVSPMIHALRASPDQFEFSSGSLHHIPSRHRFQFDEGRVRVDAHCDCAFLAVEHRQETALCEAFQEWHVNYWRPVEINREFASHFTRPSWIRRALINLTERLHRWLMTQPQHQEAYKSCNVPAE
jgi:hypothetical protein